MSLRYILAVSLNNSSLTVVYTTLTSVHSSFETKTILDFELGFAALPNYPDSTLYWSQIRTTILSAAKVSRKPLDTLLLGEDGTNETLLETLRGALQSLQDPLLVVQRINGIQQAKLRL